MGAIYDFESEKLLMGIIYHDESVLEGVLKELTEKFGKIDMVSEEYSFSRKIINLSRG